MAGHMVFLAAFIVSGFILLLLGAAGYIICGVVLPVGSLASSATMRALTSRSRSKSIPVALTTTSVVQVR